MNTIGKILVILNLVFALVVGGFLVIDFATRTNWKRSYESLKQEWLVAEANYKVSIKTLADLTNEIKRKSADLETLKQELADKEKAAKAREDSLALQLQEANDRAKDADLNYQKALAEKERLKEEIKGLAATVASREQTIASLQKESQRLRTEAIANENVAKAMQSRNENLLAQIQELHRKEALRDAGVGSDAVVARNPNAPNPPSKYVKGKIDVVDTKGSDTIVQISLGTDHGVNKNNTLEVFRLSPRPEYLGMIRIVDADPHKSVGKLMPAYGGKKVLQQGDTVASTLSVNQ